jgi:hypothetical protein
VFAAPVVGVVLDAAGFVDGDLVALHDPFQGGLAVDDVVAGFERDAIEGEVGFGASPLARCDLVVDDETKDWPPGSLICHAIYSMFLFPFHGRWLICVR